MDAGTLSKSTVCEDVPYLMGGVDPGGVGHTLKGHGVGISGIGATYFATDGSLGQVTVARAGSGPSATLATVSARDVTMVTDFALAAVPAGAPFAHQAMVRINGTSYYLLNTRIETNGGLRIYISRVVSGTETQLRSVLLNTFAYTAG